MLNLSFAEDLMNRKHFFECNFFLEGPGTGTTINSPARLLPHPPSDQSANGFFIICPAANMLSEGKSRVPRAVSVLCPLCDNNQLYEVRWRAACSVLES